MVLLTWLGVICCGVANTLIYLNVAPPERYYYILVVCLVCACIIMTHYHYTKHKFSEYNDYDEESYPICVRSLPVVISLAVIALISGATAFTIGFFTMTIAFIIMGFREFVYA